MAGTVQAVSIKQLPMALCSHPLLLIVSSRVHLDARTNPIVQKGVPCILHGGFAIHGCLGVAGPTHVTGPDMEEIKEIQSWRAKDCSDLKAWIVVLDEEGMVVSKGKEGPEWVGHCHVHRHLCRKRLAPYR